MPTPTPLPSPGDPTAYERRWWILGVLVPSLVVVMTPNTSLNLAIPSLVRETGASSSQLQWIVDTYALGSAASSSPGDTTIGADGLTRWTGWARPSD